jgi:hypothetical protein
MQEFGDALRKAREAAGLTVDDIFLATRINIKHLRAIEAGDFPSVPQTYVRAFIREYAEQVGLDPDDTLRRYNDLAETDKGIPRPPEPIDNRNILPKADDSIEILPPPSRQPRHVEIQGVAEVAEQEAFTPPVRKSTYVPAETRQREAETPPEPPAAAEPAIVPADAPEELPGRMAVTFDDTLPPAPEIRPQPADTGRAFADAGKATAGASGHAAELGAPPPRSPRSYERRMRAAAIAALVLVILAVAAYIMYYFGPGSSLSEGMIDSTAIKASIEAGRFIDSSTAALFTEPPAPADTASAATTPLESAVDQAERAPAREDSLVLEAFSTASVWFSVKMDTVRSEKGTMTGNDHRVWKARDRFVVTLGDAGAITFYLNGRELGTLGADGEVVKNLSITRQTGAGGN